MSRSEDHARFEVGDWTVLPSRLRMERGEEHVELEPKVMDVLLHLAERPGTVHSRRELLDALWPDVVVGDEALTRAVYELRKAMGDSSRSPRYVETIPKIGYRLIAEVHRKPDGSEEPLDPGPGEKKFRTLLDESFDISTVINRDGTIRYAVPAMERVLGHPAEEVRGRSIFDLIVPEDRDRVREEFQRSLRRDGLSATIEARFIHADGTTRVLRGHGHAFFEDPDIDGLLLMTRDVTPARPGGPEGSTSHGTSRTPSRVGLALASIVLLLLVGASVWGLTGFGGDPEPRAEGPPTTGTIPVTTEPGIERGPRVSPDGEQLVYARAEVDGDSHLVVRDLEGGTSLQLTRGEGSDYAPAWSPDGRRIAFLRIESGRCRIFSIPSLGGPEEELAACNGARNSVYHHLSWSPDGRWLAFSDGPDITINGAAMYVLDLLTGSLGPLRPGDAADPPAASVLPTFSPAGDRIAFVRHRDGEYDLVVAGFRDGNLAGAPTVVVRDVNHVDGIAWARGGRDILFSSDRSGPFTLYRTGLDGGEPTPLGLGVEAHRPATAPDREIVLFEAWTMNDDIWMHPGPAGEGRIEPRRILDSTQVDFQPAVRSDGSLAFFSTRTGRVEVWLAGPGGRDPVLVTGLEANGMLLPIWSPDERRLLFAAQVHREGIRSWDLYVLDDLEGSTARRLVEGQGYEIAGAWTEDGRWIYFGSRRSGSWEIWRVPVGGGAPEPVTERGGYVPRIAGDRLYYTKYGRDGLWVRALNGGVETRVTSRFPSWDLFWVVRDGAVWRISDEPGPYLARLDLRTGTWTRTLDLPDDVVSGFDLTPGLEHLYLARSAGTTSDIRMTSF